MARIDTTKLREQAEALPDGPQRSAALAHLGALESNAEAVRSWIEAAHQQIEREAEMARLSEEQARLEAEAAPA